MQFVLLLVAIVAGLRFGLQHWGHTVGAIGLAIVGIWILYRAAVASARYYGSLLVSIAHLVKRRDCWTVAALQTQFSEAARESPRG
ncbi:MAG: hypothetical protein H0U22_00050 [Geodermatophilaceae bacterium]|jgi:hypothetical protein|nr:hypothetical protein [Geodermatophilaceae bacterium]